MFIFQRADRVLVAVNGKKQWVKLRKNGKKMAEMIQMIQMAEMATDISAVMCV